MNDIPPMRYSIDDSAASRSARIAMTPKTRLSLYQKSIASVVLLMSSSFLQGQTFVTNPRLVLGTEANLSASVRLGDVDSDGDVDVVVANGRHWPQQNYVLLNDGRSRFPVLRPLGFDRCTTYACELADLDSDGDLDIVTGNDMADCRVYLNDGIGKFKNYGVFGKPGSVRSLTVSDLDRDGDVDILATLRGAANRIYLNDGKANFLFGGNFGVEKDSTIDVAVADVNGDGHDDLLLANRDNQPNSWILNDGKTRFEKRLEFGKAESQTRAVAAGDLNGDGHVDWVTGNIGQPNFAYLGDGTGNTKKVIPFGNDSSRTYCLALSDLDRDGDLDIVVGNVGQPNSVFFNEGDGEKFRSETFGANSNTYGLSIDDLNGDRLPDIAVANSGAQNLVFINRGDSAKRQRPRRRALKQSTAYSPSKGTNPIQPAVSADWASFRGTRRRGVAEGFSLPHNWNASPAESAEGVLWQTEVSGLGHSSPVITGDRLFLLTAIAADGDAPLQVRAGGKPTAADDNGVQEWTVLCYDKTNGNELWRQVARKGKPRATRHSKATHANTSVCVAGNRLLAFFGSEGIYCYDLDGRLLWKRDLGIINISKYGIGWGFASSPAVHDDRIAIVCDDPEAPYLAVLNLNDGQEIWRQSRKGICDRNWSTPLIHKTDDVTQIVVNGWPWMVSYDLNDGKVLWRIKGGGDNPVPSPFVANGWIYITNAHGGPAPIYVVKPGATGDLVPESKSIVWSSGKGGCYMSTPVVYRDKLYLGNSNGVIRCFDAATGSNVFQGRLGKGAGVIASLVAGDGKVYAPSENGTVYVLEAGDEMNVIAENQMGEPVLASPAISKGVIYFRTTKRLIAIGTDR